MCECYECDCEKWQMAINNRPLHLLLAPRQFHEEQHNEHRKRQEDSRVKKWRPWFKQGSALCHFISGFRLAVSQSRLMQQSASTITITATTGEQCVETIVWIYEADLQNKSQRHC